MTRIDADTDIVIVDPAGVRDSSTPSTQTPEAATSQEVQLQKQVETNSPSQGGVNQLADLVADTSISTSSQIKKQKNKDIFIAIMGMTGSGKTTFISKLTGRDLKIGHKLESCTQDIEVVNAKIGDYTVHMIDTPGFSDTHRSDTQILEAIADYLAVAYSQRIRLSGIIYLHPISDNRITNQSIKNLKMFQKLTGTDNAEGVVLVTSMWDKVSAKEGEAREEELQTKFWKILMACGAQVSRHDGSTESAKRVAFMLIHNKPFYTQLQEEIGKENKALKDTAAGMEMMAELSRIKEQHRTELEEVKELMLQAATQQNEVAVAALEEHYKNMLQDMEKIRADEKRMNNEKVQSLHARIEGLENRPCAVM
ncbi:hypothetical protein Hte_008606 [Hypoxylon texense]